MTTRILFALLCLLALATSAGAECAWVLWSYSNQEVYSPAFAFNTKAECEAGYARLKQTGADLGWVWTCLPDTVDPRPKGTK